MAGKDVPKLFFLFTKAKATMSTNLPYHTAASARSWQRPHCGAGVKAASELVTSQTQPCRIAGTRAAPGWATSRL